MAKKRESASSENRAESNARKYIGPEYKNALIVHGVKPKIDPKNWDDAKQAAMIRVWPQLEDLFE